MIISCFNLFITLTNISLFDGWFFVDKLKKIDHIMLQAIYNITKYLLQNVGFHWASVCIVGKT